MTRKVPWWRLTPLKSLFLVLAGITAGVGLARLQRASGYSYGGNSTREFDRDPLHLLPSFAQRLEQLFQRLRARGYDPYLYEGFKSGSSTLQGYGAAAHVISASRGTSDTGFFQALGDEAELLDLTWGGKRAGPEHNPSLVLAIPSFLVSEFQGLETNGARERFLRETYSA